VAVNSASGQYVNCLTHRLPVCKQVFPSEKSKNHSPDSSLRIGLFHAPTGKIEQNLAIKIRRGIKFHFRLLTNKAFIQ
jgi:hypothetical protein